MKRMLAVVTPAVLLLLAVALPAGAHDVKDPVCRMTVDSDTAAFRHRLGSKTFYFCSQQCEKKFAGAPGKYEKLAEQLERQDLHTYRAELKTSPNPTAGKPVEMTFSIRYAGSGEPVREFEVIHERLLHLIMVTEDLAWFEHQHPVRIGDGVFRLTWSFPRPGRYRLYVDFTPSDGDNQVLPLSLKVGGGVPSRRPLVPDTARAKRVGDLTFELAVLGGPLRMERPVLLTYRVRDRAGRPVRDMQPFIGAMGHLLAISQDGKEVLHTHALQSASQPSMTGEEEPFRVTPAMVTASGPAFTFKLTPPGAGLYKTWAQFMYGNRVYTVPFTFRVADLWTAAEPATRTAPAGVQRATVVIDGEYRPGRVSVSRGRPVELTFVRKETAGCGDVLSIPALKVRRELKHGERFTVRFTPKKTGEIRFTCGMQMYRGVVAVR